MKHLDKKIKQWAEAYQPEKKGGAKDVVQKIIQNSRSVKHLGRKNSKMYSRQLFWTRIVLAVNTLLLVVLISQQFWSGKGPSVDNLFLGSQELNEMRAVMEELDKVFPEGIQWVYQSDEHIRISPGNPLRVSKRATTGNILLAFHLIKKEGKQKELVKNYYIIAREEEPVEMDGKSKTKLWTHQVDENHIWISLQMLFQDQPFQLSIQDQFLLTMGTQYKIATATSHNQTYEIYQSAHKL